MYFTNFFLSLGHLCSLEISLRSYSCLTTGDTIMIPYNNKKYYIDIVETKPSNAISVIETDCEVDFAQPLDYIEPEKLLPSASSDKGCTEGCYCDSFFYCLLEYAFKHFLFFPFQV